ncbi:MAG: membrane protein insertase YidC [Opitutaceae bacterium]
MDKKNTVIGVLLLAGAFVALYLTPKPPQPPPRPPGAAVPAATTPTAPVSPSLSPASPNVERAFETATQAPVASATLTTLSNDYIEVHFTNLGGAIHDVALKKYPAVQGKPEAYIFNGLHADPMLALIDFPGVRRDTAFELVSAAANEVVYRAVLNGELEITRHYIVASNDGKNTDRYQLRHETTFRNVGERSIPAQRLALTLGTVAPANRFDTGAYTTTGYSTNGKQKFIMRASLDSSRGFFGTGIGAHGARPPVTNLEPMTWTTVKNQFFAAILAPDEPATGLITGRVKIRDPLPSEDENHAYGISGVTQFDLKAIEPRGETKLGMNFYVGPKEYDRLSDVEVFKAGQDKVMEFGFFKFFSQLLNKMMTWAHGFVGNWGVAVILTTLTLKIATLPLTLKASKSMKRMQKLAPEMKIIREKYKDSPQKQQSAMMELYKQHKVNPLGGCIPMLLPMPFFFGFYTMLQSTAELRFAPFLWAPDLSAPDTVGHILGVPINILPLLLGATTFLQMHLTPVVNMDKTQAAMMKFTPLIFLVICYNFSCALSLYSTVNGLFTIVQQLYINRMKDDGDPTPAINDRLKNVTPAKKKK